MDGGCAISESYERLKEAERHLREQYGGKAGEYGAEIIRFIREQDRNIGRLERVEAHTGISTNRLMHGMPAIADYFQSEIDDVYAEEYDDEFSGVDDLKWSRARKGGYSWNFDIIRKALS